MSQELSLNGIDATTGGPLDDFPVTTEIIAKVARGQRITPEDLRDAKIKNSLGETAHFGVAEGIDVSDLSQTGCLICARNRPPPSIQTSTGNLSAPITATKTANRKTTS